MGSHLPRTEPADSDLADAPDVPLRGGQNHRPVTADLVLGGTSCGRQKDRPVM